MPCGLVDGTSAVLDEGNPVLQTIREGHPITEKIHKLRVYNPEMSNTTVHDKRRDHRAYIVAMSILGTNAQVGGPYQPDAEYAELSLLTLSTGLRKIALNGAKLRFEFCLHDSAGLSGMEANMLRASLMTWTIPGTNERVYSSIPVSLLPLQANILMGIDLLNGFTPHQLPAKMAAASYLWYLASGGTNRINYHGLRLAFVGRTLLEIVERTRDNGHDMIRPSSITFNLPIMLFIILN